MRPLGVYIHALGVYIRSLGLVSWSVEDEFLWLVGVPMAIESLSGSWSAQVNHTPWLVKALKFWSGISRKACGRGFLFRVPQGV